ncbi:MAG: hypothetical protein CMO55_08890 [Verrucomicrobiales bacterium]|nr:hypothetical protein [Verrucomicrobiales bacterium]
MATLTEVQKQADSLSEPDKEELLRHLLNTLPDAPLGPDDEEVARRVEEMESGAVQPISHDQFLAEVGRK